MSKKKKKSVESPETPSSQTTAQQPVSDALELSPPFLANWEAVSALETELDELLLASLLESAAFPTHLLLDQLYRDKARQLFECQYDIDGIVVEMKLVERAIYQPLMSFLTIPCQISAIRIAPHLLETSAGELSQLVTQVCQKAYSAHFFLWFNYQLSWQVTWSEVSRDTARKQMLAESRLRMDGERSSRIYTVLGPSDEEVANNSRQALQKTFTENYSEIWKKGIARYLREDPAYNSRSVKQQSSLNDVLQLITERLEK